MKISVKVWQYGGTHIATAQGWKVSCTSQESVAVQRLALKVARKANPEITEDAIKVKFVCAAANHREVWSAEWSEKAWKLSRTLPDADTTVMVYHPDWAEPLWLGYHDGEAWLWVEGETCSPQPSHWMDFPEPPKV